MGLSFKIEDETAQVYDISPVNQDIVLTDEEEKDQIFTRRKINPLVLLGSDYHLLKGMSEQSGCQRLEVTINHRDVERWRGLINLKTGRWSDRRCRLEISVEPLDGANKVISIWEKKVNVLTIAATSTAYPFIGVIECQECTLPPPASPANWPLSSPITADDCGFSPEEGWTITRNEINGVTLVSSSPLLYRAELMVITRYCREFFAGVTMPPGSGWVAVTGGYARTVTTVLDNNKSDFDPEDGKLLQYYNVVGLDTETGDQQAIDNGVLFETILNYFAGQAGLTCISNFFSVNIDSSAPDNAPYLSAASNLTRCALFQKTDIKRPGAYENATRGEMTFKEFLDMLREVFNAYWIVDGDILRVEHYSYFEENQGLNLTDIAAVQIASLNDYTNIEDKLSPSETFAWSDPTQIRDFAGEPILYEDGCADPEKDPIPHKAGRFYTDIQTAQRQPSLVADDGFIIANLADYDGNLYFIQETGLLSGGRWTNGHMAWSNLHENYHKWNRLFPTGNMNGDDVVFNSSIRLKEQEPLNVPLSLDDYFLMNPSDTMQSEIGWGKPKRLQYSVRKCLLTTILNH